MWDLVLLLWCIGRVYTMHHFFRKCCLLPGCARPTLCFSVKRGRSIFSPPYGHSQGEEGFFAFTPDTHPQASQLQCAQDCSCDTEGYNIKKSQVKLSARNCIVRNTPVCTRWSNRRFLYLTLIILILRMPFQFLFVWLPLSPHPNHSFKNQNTYAALPMKNEFVSTPKSLWINMMYVCM